MLFNLFNSKKTVTVQLDRNVKLALTPTVGGVNAELTETTDMFLRQERAFFATLDDLVKSLGLTDNVIIRKLSKAF